jgi:hypothetical protein
MTDDLKLPQVGELTLPRWQYWLARYNEVLSEKSDRIEKLEVALRNIAEGDIPRTVKIPFRDDGQSSKHDRCEHGQWFYEDCGCCIEDYARKALEGKENE